MSTPEEPRDEYDSDETPVPPPATPPGQGDEDSAWRSIIDNYGDRPELEEPEAVAPPPPAPDFADPDLLREDPEDHFVPPLPPPIPRPEPPRLLAWLGLFGVPTFVLLTLLTGVQFPSWVGLILMVWFVGGFVYLVASMRPEERDGYDDGAVL